MTVSNSLKPLFPALEPYDSGHLPLDPPHVMYYEQSGNPQGVPVLFLHGGPGGGSSQIVGVFLTRAITGSFFTTNGVPGTHDRLAAWKRIPLSI